jgi:hypothetical protein
MTVPDGMTLHAELWRQLLLRLSEEDSMQQASVVQRQSVLDALARLQGSALDTVGPAAVRWIERGAVGRDEIVEPFHSEHQPEILHVWQRLAEHYLLGNETNSEERFGPSHGERLFGLANNTPAGKITFIALALLDRARRAPDRLSEISRYAGNIEMTLRNAAGTARTMVAARLTEWAHVSALLMPRTTEEMVFRPIQDAKDEIGLTLLDVHALYGRALTDSIYTPLEAVMASEAKLARLSQRGVAQIVARLTWRVLDHLARVHRAAPNMVLLGISLFGRSG